MHTIKYHTDRATESEIVEIIFNACRANESRESVKIGDCTVTFNNSYTQPGEYLAIVKGWDGRVSGCAIVDTLDC